MLVRSLRALPAARPAVGLRGMTTLLAMRRVPAARAAPVAVLQQPRRWLAGTAFLDEADVTDRVLGCVKAFQKVDAAKVTAQSHFLNDLGLDSLDTVEVVMAFEDEFVIEIPDADAEKIHSCEDAIAYIASHPHAK